MEENSYEMGEAAARLIFKMINKNDDEEEISQQYTNSR